MHRHLERHGVHTSTVPPRRPEIVPRHRLPYLMSNPSPTHVKREPAPAGSDSSSNTCGSGSSSCEKYSSSTNTATLPVVLGAVVPIVCAIIVLFFLHRRHVKKLHREDANDKHKSLDFGMDIVDPARGPGPMQEANQPYPNHAKGISLDVGHPYLAPPTLHDSRDSFNSLPQSVTDDGKYRPANSYFGNDSMSIRSHPRMFQDDASSFTGSTSRLALGDDMNQGLLRNAQRMSRSSPPLHENPPIDHNVKTSINHGQGDLGFQLDLPRSVSPLAVPASQHGEQGPGVAMASTALGGDVSQEAGYTVQSQDAHSANVTLSDHRTSHLGPTHDQSQQDSTQSSSSQPPRISLPFSDGGSDYTDNMKSTTMIPDVTVFGADDVPQHEGAQDSGLAPEERTNRQTLALDTRRDTRRFTLGLRPLPPEDPSDNPEQRANRIRSFYKEYFDENKPGRETTYYEDYGPEFYDSIMYDDYYNPMPPPFAEPVGRRAMTPPPRAPPRFQGPPRHMATGSVGGWSGFNSPGPRAFSSASGRLPGARGPRRPAPPPSPLQELPTPHMLRNDDAIMQAADFAPGKNFKDQREGRAGTPLGGLRPFSPMAPVHSPLVSSFDELSAMPSPHALRKSGTYTNLDFAPPPRFKNTETASDAGSIRSNGTGISYTHLHNIRTGAYRISRLPVGMVGTRDDMAASLRPQWDMRS